MGRENQFPQETIESGELVRGINSAGESVNFTSDAIKAFANSSQSFAIYDGASDITPYVETFSSTAGFTHGVRLEFSGARNDESYFPSGYGNLLVNQLSAPNPSNFDFRLLPLGTQVMFDVEFDLRLANDSGERLDRSILFTMEMTYPNGSTEKRSFAIPNDYLAATQEIRNNVKLSFSTYIKVELTDKLLGGGITYSIVDTLSPTEIITVNDLIVRARL